MSQFSTGDYPSATEISCGLRRAKAISDVSKYYSPPPRQLAGEAVSKSIEFAMRPATLRAIQGSERPLNQALQGVARSVFTVTQTRNDASYMASALSGLSKGLTPYSQILGADVASQALQSFGTFSSYQLRALDIDFSRVYRSMYTLSGVLQQSAGFDTVSHTRALLQNVARSVIADLNVYGLWSSVPNLAREMQRAQSFNRLPRDWIITTPYRAPTVSPEYGADTVEPEASVEIFVPLLDIETGTHGANGTPVRDFAGNIQSWIRENYREIVVGTEVVRTGIVAIHAESVTAMAISGAAGVFVTVWMYKQE